jgi:curved DNA-binding protein CbpA
VVENWYTVLGVPSSASDEEIKLAYRELALIHHPDRNPGDSEAVRKFMRIKAAYKGLLDAKERKTLDLELAYEEEQEFLKSHPTKAAAHHEPARRRPLVKDIHRNQAWSTNSIVVFLGAIVAFRGFLGVYAVTWADLLDKYLSVGGGRDRAFLMMLVGIIIAIFGLSR